MTPSVAIGEIPLPRTDAGAGMQVLLVITITAVAAIALRRERSLVTLVFGVGMVMLGFIGIRALH